MERQLTLIDVPKADWKLDEHTREIGKKGLEEAREALRQAAAAAARKSAA